MKVVAIALVLLQASLHSDCRTYNTATPKNDTDTSKHVKLPSKLIQILESLDSPDAKITKIKELIPVYNDFPEFRVKSNKKHLFMPYKKKGKPLAYILKKTYVNEIVSDHTDESSDSLEDVKNNEMLYKGKPKRYKNKVYYSSSQNEKITEKHGMYEFPKMSEIQIKVDGEEKDESEIKVNDNDQYDKNKLDIEESVEILEDLKEPILVLPTEHKRVHHTHRHNIENSEEKADVVSNSDFFSDVATKAKQKESNHYHHGYNPQDMQLFQSDVKSDDTDSNREQIPEHQKVTEDKPIDSIPKNDKIEQNLDQLQAINVHKHHHHQESDVSIAAVASTDVKHSLNISTTKHGHPKIYLDEENVNSKHDLIHHIVAHHTEDPHNLVKIDADELHSDKFDVDSNLKHKHAKSNLELLVDTKATEQKLREKEHSSSHSHSTHHHSSHKESVKDLDKYLSYLNELDLVSPKTNKEIDLNLSNNTAIEAILNNTGPVSKENNDNNAADFNIIVPGRPKLMINQVALTDSKLDSHISDFSASEYYSDEFVSSKSSDASGSSEPSSEFIDSFSDSNQESTETDDNSSSSESENTSVYSIELVTNDSNSYSESNSAFNSKSLEFDSLQVSSSQSESSLESNEPDISGLEELHSEASNLISESVELSSESDSINFSDESNSSQLNDNLGSSESHSSELSNSEISLNSISVSDNSDSVSQNDSKSDFSSSSDSGYLSQSESEESSEIDSADVNDSASKELIIESNDNQFNSTVNLAPTILIESNSFASASDLNSKESYLESIPTDIDLDSFGSYSSLEANQSSSDSSTARLEPSPSNLVTVFSYSSNVEYNTPSIEDSVLLETTLNSSSTASKESADSSLVTASIVETPVPDLQSIASSLMSSASSVKSVASSLESSAISFEYVPGMESMASKLNTAASELVYVALNLETSAMSLNWGSGLSTALNLMASSTESIVRSDMSTESSAILESNLESITSNQESIPSFGSISQIIEKSPSSPAKVNAFYSTNRSRVNKKFNRAVKKNLCKDRPDTENKLSNGKKTYSMSFVFNK